MDRTELTKKQEKLLLCRHCGKKLGLDYHYQCIKCNSSYCYIHFKKHKHST